MPIDNLVYHLGPYALTSIRNGPRFKFQCVLTDDAQAHWVSVTNKKVAKELPKLIIQLPAKTAAR